MDTFFPALAVFAVSVLASLAGASGTCPGVLYVAKPLATFSLLFVLGPDTGDRGDLLFAAGIVLATLGDFTILFERPAAFLGGLVLFLLAHLAYTAAFLTGGVAPSATLIATLAFVAASIFLLVKLIPRVEAALKLPVAAYTAVITAMVAVACGAGAVAAWGGTLFYLSDAHLAWTRFRRTHRGARVVNLSLYWAGQLLIALAARWSH